MRDVSSRPPDRLDNGLRSFDIASRSPKGTGVVLDGDSRTSPALLCRQSPKGISINRTISVIEMHTFLVTLVRQFEFALPDNGREVWRMNSGIMTPVVIGEEHKGPQLWLKVAALRNE